MLHSGERIDHLIREGIDIIQSKDVFSFSLDAVLLAYFTKIPNRKQLTIVDACSGNGAVAFMISARTHHKVIAIEYQERLADMAQRTVALNQLEDKVEVICGDYKQSRQWIKYDSVDVITCNPPYFEVSDTSLKNDRTAYALARHELTLTLDEWVFQSAKLLKMGGKLYCVHRPDRLLQILETMKRHRLMPKCIQFVHPKEGKEANMVLIEAIKEGKDGGVRVLAPIVVFDEQNNYLPLVNHILFGDEDKDERA